MSKVHKAVETYLEVRRMARAGQVPSCAMNQARELIKLAVVRSRSAA